MAEALFAFKLMRDHPSLLPGVETSSCGVEAEEGDPASVPAVQAMDLWGLDLEPHRARRLTPQRLGEADLVLTMESGHLRAVGSLRREAREKSTTLMFLAGAAEAMSRRLGRETVRDEEEARDRLRQVLEILRGMSPEGDFLAGLDARGSDIIDPIGSSLQVYIEVAEEIDRSLDAVMGALFGPPEASP